MADAQEQPNLEKIHVLINDGDVYEVIDEIRSIVGDGVSIRKLIEEYEQPTYILAKLRKFIPLQLVLELNPTTLYCEMGKEFDSGDAELIVNDIGAFVSNVIDWAIADRVATRADDYDLDEEEIVFGEGFSVVEDVRRVEDNVYVVKTNSGSLIVHVNEGGHINHMSNQLASKEHDLIVRFMEEHDIQDPRMIKAKTPITPDSMVIATCPDESLGHMRIALNYVPSEFEHMQKLHLPNSYKGKDRLCYVFSNSEKEMLAVINIIRLMEDSNIAECFEQDIQSYIEQDGVNVYQL